MKHFYYAILLCLCAFSLTANAQTDGKYPIKGVVIDSMTNLPESFATIYLFPASQESKALQTAICDDNGRFQFKPIKSGNYRITVTCYDRNPVTRSFTLGSKELTLDTIRLKKDEIQLSGAVVKAQRPLIKAEIDKIAYQISEDPEAKTNTTLEMLRKVPMVSVDGEDNIQVNGSSSFKVYVNGKPNQMMSSNPSEIFKNYPAAVIKKIEVITNPGARYDAEGVAGVLNIITEGDARTTGYSITPSINYDSHGYRASVFGLTQVGKLMLSAHYGVGHNARPKSINYSEREVYNDPLNHFLTSNGSSKHTGTFHFGSLEGSYEFDKHNLLSVSAGLRGHSAKEHGLTSYNMLSSTAAPVYSYANASNGRHSKFGINASADYQHSFNKEGEALTFSYRMDLNPNKDKSYNNYQDLVNVPASFNLHDLFSDTRNHSDEHTFQLDYTVPFDSIQTFSTGVKYIYRINKSDNEEKSRPSGTTLDYELDSDRSLLYRHRGDILGAYAEYSIKVQKLTAKAGVRYEYYNIDVTYPDGKRPGFDKKLNDFVPSVSFGYNLTETKMLKLGYNMRIGRPGIGSLSPYINHNTPESISYGNPDLTSEHAHNFEAGFSSFGLKFNINSTLTYSVSTDGITSYSFIDNGIVNTTSDNFMHRKSAALDVFIRANITKTTSINLNMNGRYTDYRVNEIGNHHSGWSARCFGGIQQQLPYKFKLGIWGGGSTPEINIQGKGSKFYFYSLNLSRSFLKEDRLEITLQANNFIGRYHYFTNETTTPDYHFYSKNRADFLRFGVGVRYRFGSLKAQVKKAKRTINNDDKAGDSHSDESSNDGSGSGDSH